MQNISKAIVKWYEQNKRALPWRDTKNPYQIWISEIILQQTRVNQGINYYYRFIKNFPDIFALANTPVEKVLKTWQGLGYYSRARNMHYTANIIVKEYKGKFPSNFSDLKTLKGIGEYTAAAIASIAFNKPEPALDGNVYRVLSRLFGIAESPQKAIGKKIFRQKAIELIKNQSPGTFNQALMEFGALQCIPINPDCNSCILQKYCFAFQNNMINELPIKKQKINQRLRYFNFLHIFYNNKTYIEQRTQNDIWKLLYQYPLIESNHSVTIEYLTKLPIWAQLFDNTRVYIQQVSEEKTHQLTHQKIFAKFYTIKISQPNQFLLTNYKEIKHNTIQKYSVPKLIDNYLQEVDNKFSNPWD